MDRMVKVFALILALCFNLIVPACAQYTPPSGGGGGGISSPYPKGSITYSSAGTYTLTASSPNIVYTGGTPGAVILVNLPLAASVPKGWAYTFVNTNDANFQALVQGSDTGGGTVTPGWSGGQAGFITVSKTFTSDGVSNWSASDAGIISLFGGQVAAGGYSAPVSMVAPFLTTYANGVTKTVAASGGTTVNLPQIPNYTAVTLYEGDCTSGNLTYQLPVAGTPYGNLVSGAAFHFKRLDNSANTFTISGTTNGVTIDGATSKTITTQNGTLSVYINSAGQWSVW